MSTATVPSRDQLIARISDLNWVHKIDLGGGVVTPGIWGDHNPSIWKALDDIDFRGKKVLDIGCWDGLWSFEAEKRGAAEVYATDYSSQRYTDQSTFRLAHQILGSKARYFPDTSVYHVDRLGVDDFDVVLYAGVYYHLKDPLRSFASLRRVMKEGGQIVVEGGVLDGPEGCYAQFFYRDMHMRDASNWWVPTIPCLRQWVECNFFEVEREYDKWSAGENHRYVLTARAVRRKDPLYFYPDDDLREFDLNDY
jgi:tRNA (mo5U34)-methyltransferase